jgi:hypothetical protein
LKVALGKGTAEAIFELADGVGVVGRPRKENGAAAGNDLNRGAGTAVTPFAQLRESLLKIHGFFDSAAT